MAELNTANKIVKTPILQLVAGSVPERVLVVGDPKRAKYVSGYLTDTERICKNREYHIYKGLYKGISVCVASHGVGATGANVLFEELISIGVKIIIRAGTCGTLLDAQPNGSHLIVTSAVRDDGASAYLIPTEYPASANFDVVQQLHKAAQEYGKVNPGYSYSLGICHTIANFYSGFLRRDDMMWKNARIFGQDMETSSLLVVGAMRGIKTGGILTVDGNIFAPRDTEYNPYADLVKNGVIAMIIVGLDALVATEPENTTFFTF